MYRCGRIFKHSLYLQLRNFIKKQKELWAFQNENLAFMKKNLTLSSFSGNSESFCQPQKKSSRMNLNIDAKFMNKPGKFFHTSSARNINPVVALVLRPVAKIAAVLVGRGFRKWWKSLPKDKRRLFLDHIIRNKWKYLASFVLVGGTSYSLYEKHVCVTPYTERKRFMVFNSAQIAKISEFSFQVDAQKLKDHFLVSTHPHVVRTKRICERLLQGNRDVPEIYTKFWTVFVVDVPEENCKVYPTGQIVMYNGMLDLTDNDDQIAMILSHEISHVILEHTAELFNYAALLDIIIFVPLALIWALLPNDGVAIVADWFFKRAVDTLLQLPYSRKLEKEADAAGIFLAASACFDVREASTFWGRLDLIEKYRQLHGETNEASEIAFLSTHPSHLERQSYLDELMAGALQTREDKKCPRLRKPDPRESVWAVQQRYGTIPDDKKLVVANKNLQMANETSTRLQS